MKDNYVADELLKLKQLLDSGAITQSEYDSQKSKLLNEPPAVTDSKQNNPAPPQKKKKKPGCLIVVIILFVISAIVTIAIQSTTSNKMIIDMTQFSGLNYEQLSQVMGGPGTRDEYGVPLTTVSGRSVNGAIFYYPEQKLEFVIADDQVIRATYSCEESPIEYSSSKDIMSMFGISPNSNAKVTADTPAAYRVSPVNDKVADFWVPLMDSSNKTFEMVKVTYNVNYIF